jgi:hypothetical protein
MESYALGKDIQQIKDRLSSIEARLNLGADDLMTDDGFEFIKNLAGERTYCVLANHTFRDIHVQVSGDVHTGNWGPNQINHNSEPEIKSRKIDFGNEAKYQIKVWKNNGGQPGDFIGEFEHRVRYNLAGNRDHLEFIIITIDETTYLRVFSVRRALEVALIIWIGA